MSLKRRKLWVEQFGDIWADQIILDPLQRLERVRKRFERYIDKHVNQVWGHPDENRKVNLETDGVGRKLEDLNHLLVPYDFLSCYLKTPSKGIYKIASRFGHHLKKTNLNVPCSAMGMKFQDTLCLEFADDMPIRSPKGAFWYTAIVVVRPMINRDEDRIFTAVEVASLKSVSVALCIFLPDYDANGQLGSYGTTLSLNLRNDTISDAISNIIMEKEESLAVREVVDFVSKCLLYINSGDPDLTPLAGRHSTSKKEKKRRQVAENVCPFDVVNVGYSFHHRMRYIDQTLVSGHFRWQPHGKERSQVKLIWIDEHERKYLKDEVQHAQPGT